MKRKIKKIIYEGPDKNEMEGLFIETEHGLVSLHLNKDIIELKKIKETQGIGEIDVDV